MLPIFRYGGIGFEFSERAALIVEVLSKSTSSIDRREKVFAYRQIPSLMEYLIVQQNRKKVQLHRRENDQWAVLEFGPGDEFEFLASLYPLKISIEQIYEEIDWNKGNSWEVKETVASYSVSRTKDDLSYNEDIDDSEW